MLGQAGQAGVAANSRATINSEMYIKISRGDHGTRNRRNANAAHNLQNMRVARPQLRSHLFQL
jgi:hypothetical protein